MDMKNISNKNIISTVDMKNINKTMFTWLIIRDPIERIISSFKNKYACDNNAFYIDKHNRERFVPELLGLRDKELHQLRKTPMFNVSHYKENTEICTCTQNVHKNVPFFTQT